MANRRHVTQRLTNLSMVFILPKTPPEICGGCSLMWAHNRKDMSQRCEK